MRVFRQQYKGRDGQTKSSQKWYVEIRDHRRVVRRIAGFTDKGQTRELGNRIEKLAAFRMMNASPDAELVRWFDTIPDDIREKLAEIGLIDSRTASNAKPLLCPHCGSVGKRTTDRELCECDGEHVSAFRRYLIDKGGTVEHAELVTSRIRNVLKGCGFVMYGDISASRVSEYLAGLRKAEDGISAQTSNFYLTAMKSFCRFMVKDRRATENPVAHLDGLNVATDRRHDRRNLTPDELSRLLQTTATGPIRHKLSGFSRTMLYRVAMESGLRRKELRELSVGSFDLDSPTPSVMLEAGKSKNRKVTVLPVRPQLVEELRRWFATLPDAPETRLWPTLTQHTAKMLKADLEAAGIVYVDDAGLFADFHSLRHSFVSMLAAGNVHPKLAQRLARHSDINLTMNRYSHTLLTDEAEALKALPEFPSAFTSERPEVQTLKATGTDGRGENVLPSGLPFSDAFRCISMHQGDIPNPEMPTRPKNEKPLNPSGKTKKFRGSSSGEAGIRTLGPLAETPVFKTGAPIPQLTTSQGVTQSSESVLPSGLPFSHEISSDLRSVVNAWPDLPEHLKATILTLVNASKPGA